MKIILVSHGNYSQGMMDSVQMLLGGQENIVAYGLYPEDSVTSLTEKLEKEIKKSGDEELIFFTDLYHGSPFNSVVSLTEHYKLHHITGINLPLLIEAVMARNGGSTPDEICERLMVLAPSTILDVGKSLNEGGE